MLNENRTPLMFPQTGPEQWFRAAPAVDLDSVCGMKELKSRLRSEIERITNPLLKTLFDHQTAPGYLFYGLPGSGKSHCISAFVRGLVDKGYRYMQVSPRDILSNYVGESEMIVDRIFQTAMDAAPCVLVFQDVECICRDRTDYRIPQHRLNLTNAFLAAYNKLRELGKDVVFIGETSAPWELDVVLVDWVQLIPMPAPDEDTRSCYIRQQLSPARLNGEQLQELVDATVNSSFRYMRRLTDSIMEQLKTQIAQGTDGTWTDVAELERTIRSVLESDLVCPTQAMLKQALEQNPHPNYAPYLRQLDAFEARLRGRSDL